MAIDFKELRYGNIIHYEGAAPDYNDEEDVVIASISESELMGYAYTCYHGIDCHRCYHTNNPSFFSPIALTEKWMEKFGMVTLDNEIDQIIWGFDGPKGDNFCYVSDGFQQPLPIYFEYDSGTSDVRKEIKWVHELQNLHFALTGEELQIKEVNS